MLTEYQANLVIELSHAVSLGLYLGFLGAALASACIAILRRNRHDIKVVFQRCVVGIWAGVISSLLVAIAVTTIGISLFPIGFKGVRESPDWLMTTQVVCAVAVAAFMQSDWARPKSMPIKNRVTRMSPCGFGRFRSWRNRRCWLRL